LRRARQLVDAGVLIGEACTQRDGETVRNDVEGLHGIDRATRHDRSRVVLAPADAIGKAGKRD
jgi:hypothetical protein